MKLKIYLSYPLSFSTSQQEVLLPEFISILESLKLEVHKSEDKNHIYAIETKQKAEEHHAIVSQHEKANIEKCDAFFAILNCTPDKRFLIEISIAIALKKKIFIFRNDHKNINDMDNYPINLYFSNYNKDEWQNCYFTAISEISSPERELCKWIASYALEEELIKLSSKSVCVFCGSSPGGSPSYLESAKKLGAILANKGITLIYGGSSLGTMGTLASSTLEEKGKVIGILAKTILHKEKAQDNITKLCIVDSMQERKNKMIQLASGFIVLPGGGGTLEEFSDVFSRFRLGFHNKPIGILNINNYYDDLLLFIKKMVNEKFLSENSLSKLKISANVEELVDFLFEQNQQIEDTSNLGTIRKAV